jgi:hypothetical protein
VLRPFGDFAEHDIANKGKTISTVCSPRLCRYVVEVHRHDWPPDSTHYFIDMELCDLSLDDHIKEMGLRSVVGMLVKKMPDSHFLDAEVQRPEAAIVIAQTVIPAYTDRLLASRAKV